MVHEVPHERLSVHEVMAMCSGVQLGPESHRRRIAKLAGGAAAGVRQTQPQQPQQPQGQGGVGAGGVGVGAGAGTTSTLFSDHFSRVSQLPTTTHAPWYKLHVAMLIGC